MKKEIYKLANQIHTEGTKIHKQGNPDAASCQEMDTHTDFEPDTEQCLDSRTQTRYKQSVLAAIHKEKRTAAKKRFTAAAACIAILAATTAVFHNQVQAAITHIHYSLSTALGLQDSLASYKEVVHTSVSDNGYTITLQEAAAAPNRLAVSFTVQREDGQPMQNSPSLSDSLYINGQEISGASTFRFSFLDDAQKILGGELSRDISGIDLSAENTYELKFSQDSGTWSFKFTADGSELHADTKRMALGTTYVLPDGMAITLDELCINALEQRIMFHTSQQDTGRYAITLRTVDEQGRATVFYISQFDGCEGYMLNGDSVGDGCIATDAKVVEPTMYISEFHPAGKPDENGQLMKGGPEIAVKPVVDFGNMENQEDMASDKAAPVQWDLTSMQ